MISLPQTSANSKVLLTVEDVHKKKKMAHPRVALWAAEPDLDDDINDADVDIPIPLPSSTNEMYDDPNLQLDEGALLAMQQHIAQQAAFAQIPDVVKRVSTLLVDGHPLLSDSKFIVHFHQAVLDNNLQEITVAYESGWTRLTEKYYAKTEWPEAETIAPLVNDDQIFLILYRELYYRHVYSRLQPNVDDRFHSYENSCELFNYLLSAYLLCNCIISLRLGRLRRSRALVPSRTLVVGHHRRIHLSVPIVCSFSVASCIKDR